jgi:hypothetical protein
MMALLAPFPTEEWFDQLVTRATVDEEAMVRLGIAELRLGIEIVEDDGEIELYGLVLDGYDVESKGRVTEITFAPEAILSGQRSTWDAMVASIETNGGADNANTLNTLSIMGDALILRAPDAMGHDKFFRYMGTLQAIFDAAGQPEITSVSG